MKYTLYIGLNDKDTKKQEISTIEAYKLVAREACRLVTTEKNKMTSTLDCDRAWLNGHAFFY